MGRQINSTNKERGVIFKMQIKKFRERAGFTITEVARQMDVDRAAAFRWEAGTAMPRADKIPKLADLLGCSIDELFGRNPPGEAS